MRTAWPTRQLGAAACARGFSLIELSVVVLIAGLLAVTVVPAVSSLDGARVRSAASEVERRLALARGFAAATGRPAGMEVDAGLGRVRLVQIDSGQTEPSAMTDALGAEDDWTDIGVAYAGVAIAVDSLGDGSAGSGTLWFGHDGTPEVRGADGSLIGDATDDAVLFLSGFGRGWVVTVSAGTGALDVAEGP